MQEHDHVRVLLDAARITQVAEHGALVFAGRVGTAQLGAGQHGNLQLQRNGLELATDLADFQLTVLHPLVGAHQAQIVQHYQIQPLLHHQTAAAGTELGGRQAGGIVDVNAAVAQGVDAVAQLDPFFVGQHTAADALHIDVGRGAQKAQADLLRRHFQAEKSHAFVCFLGGEQRHAQRHGGFTHGRARAHQHQLAAVKAGEHPIQIVQPGRHARQLAFQQAQFLNAVEGGKQHLLNGFQRFRAAPTHDDIEDQPFRVPKHVGHRVGLGIALAADGLGRGDQLAQRGLFLHDFDVSAGVGRGGHEAHRFQQIGGSAHAVQCAPAGKLVPHRHQIDGIARDMQRLHGGENFPVLGGVKILRRQGLKGKRGRTAVLQHRAQHGTLRVYAAGRQRRNIILTFHRGVRSFPAGA